MGVRRRAVLASARVQEPAVQGGVPAEGVDFEVRRYKNVNSLMLDFELFIVYLRLS